MNNYLLRFTMLFMLLISVSCSKYDFEPITKSEDNIYISPQLERFLNSQPESKRAYYLEYGRTAKILGEHLKLNGTSYYLDISESEAKKLGVSKEMYAAHSRQVSIVNATISKNIARGIETTLLDPEKSRAGNLEPQFEDIVNNLIDSLLNANVHVRFITIDSPCVFIDPDDQHQPQPLDK